jgi:hypothetical protein
VQSGRDGGWTFVRDVLETLEDVDGVPLAARYGLWAACDGVAVEVVASSTGTRTRSAIGAALEKAHLWYARYALPALSALSAVGFAACKST